MRSCQLLLLTLLSAPAAAAPIRGGNSSSGAGSHGVGTVKYFGFWGPDAPAAMAPFTNLAFASSVADAAANRAAGLASLLKVEHIFVNTSVRFGFKLQPDFQAGWAAVAPGYKELLRNGTIIGFFLGDEMLWNGLPLADLQTYVRAVRATFPAGDAILYTNAAWPTQLPTMVGQPQRPGGTASVPDANLWRTVPTELDWFSVDIYPNEASVAGWVDLELSRVLPKMAAHQSLVLVPPFYGDRGVSATRTLLDCDDVDCDAAMTRWANFTRDWLDGTAGIRGADRVVAVTPYHWVSLGNGSGTRQLGGSELPRARAAWEAFGRSVVQKGMAEEGSA